MRPLGGSGQEPLKPALEGQQMGVSSEAYSAALLTTAEMAAADEAAVAGGVPSLALMENAGRAVADAIHARWRQLPVLVLAGPGNNGGDGLVVARLLREAGWPVRVVLFGAVERLPADARVQLDRWGTAVKTPPADPGGLLGESALIVDALFGAGLSRPLERGISAVISTVLASGLPAVAVDLPSGLSGDRGEALGGAVMKAALTVTFFRKKPGHLLLPGRLFCGELVVADIGIPDAVLGSLAPRAFENGPALWRHLLPVRTLDRHKYDYGHVLLRGGATMTGAARLAARAALRVGAGLVTIAGAGLALPSYALAGPSVITEKCDDAKAYASLLEDRRKNALVLGPGNGVDRTTRACIKAALASGRPTVLDADALTVLAGAPRLLGAFTGPVVLTPHEGEFRRLFPDLEGDKLARARAAASRTRAVILLKGADSAIAAPDGLAAINANAPADLATAGTGDVLAGLVGGLLAQGMAPFEAAATAVWLQGEAARAVGRGLIAEDLPEALPGVLARLA
ncbi:MAG: NAD(P)H-hydrate dehydratase [Kiloniellales bacterium]